MVAREFFFSGLRVAAFTREGHASQQAKYGF
jgi:hypothetical protein